MENVVAANMEVIVEGVELEPIITAVTTWMLIHSVQ
jgi:hypothetical protein